MTTRKEALRAAATREANRQQYERKLAAAKAERESPDAIAKQRAAAVYLESLLADNADDECESPPMK